MLESRMELGAFYSARDEDFIWSKSEYISNVEVMSPPVVEDVLHYRITALLEP